MERPGEASELELYHSSSHTDEFDNLAGKGEHSKLQVDLQKRLNEWFAYHSDPNRDLWKGG